MLPFLLGLMLQASPATVPPSSAAFRSQARASLPDDAFLPGRVVIDQQGRAVGKVAGMEHGLVAIQSEHSFVRLPASAFELRGAQLVSSLGAAQLDMLAGKTTGISSTPPPRSPHRP